MELFICIFLCFAISFSLLSTQPDNNNFELRWDINNLESIEGNPTTIIGSPNIIEFEEYGNVVWFNGIDDGILVKANPLEGAENFTVEVIFKPAGSYPENIEQRFIHIQEPGNNDKRVLIEVRLTEDNKWYLDTYIKNEASDLTLKTETLLHPVDSWHHAALVYENGEAVNYVNGKKELSGNVKYSPITNAYTSIGTRMNKESWFKGGIAVLKVTHEALSPDKFLYITNPAK